MDLRELLTSLYAWTDDHALAVLGGAIFVPILGTAAAMIGKGGRTDADGRAIASFFVGFSLTVLVAAALAVVVAHALFDASMLDANFLLLLAPVVCVALTLVWIHNVFPLKQLGSFRTARDIGAFVAACLVILWLFRMFRGWGIVFFGSLFELLLIVAVGAWLVRRLYRRAFRDRPKTP